MDHIFSPKNREFVSKRLRVRLALFFLISFVIGFLVLTDVIKGEAAWWMALAALAVGLVIGYIYGRFARVRWHPTEEKIIMQYDVLGFIIIGAYILFGIFRELLLEHFLGAVALQAITFSVLTGVLIGRFLGLHVANMRVLRERNG